MKRIGTMVSLAAIMVAATAMADNIWVIVDHLAPNESKTRSVELTPGKTTVEVLPVNAANKPNNISCALSAGIGGVIEQNGVAQCLWNLNTPSSGFVSVKTTNNEDKSIEYRILVHETVPSK